MREYTLSIQVKSGNPELLENLMVTLESLHGDLEEIHSVEVFTQHSEAAGNLTRLANRPAASQSIADGMLSMSGHSGTWLKRVMP